MTKNDNNVSCDLLMYVILFSVDVSYAWNNSAHEIVDSYD